MIPIWAIIAGGAVAGEAGLLGPGVKGAIDGLLGIFKGGHATAPQPPGTGAGKPPGGGTIAPPTPKPEPPPSRGGVPPQPNPPPPTPTPGGTHYGGEEGPALPGVVLPGWFWDISGRNPGWMFYGDPSIDANWFEGGCDNLTAEYGADIARQAGC